MNELPNGLPTLSAGFHRPGEGKACVMEYVSLLAGEEWTDTPACTNPVLARAAQAVNDGLRDDERHLLVPLIGRLFGTDAPVDNRLLVLWCARSVEHLSETAKACNDITARFMSGDASAEELRTNAAAAKVAWLSRLIDEYDRLAGRAEHRKVTDSELAALTQAVNA